MRLSSFGFSHSLACASQVHGPNAYQKEMEALREPKGRLLIPCASSLWWGEATDEPAREDARPTQHGNCATTG